MSKNSNLDLNSNCNSKFPQNFKASASQFPSWAQPSPFPLPPPSLAQSGPCHPRAPKTCPERVERAPDLLLSVHRLALYRTVPCCPHQSMPPCLHLCLDPLASLPLPTAPPTCVSQARRTPSRVALGTLRDHQDSPTAPSFPRAIKCLCSPRLASLNTSLPTEL